MCERFTYSEAEEKAKETGMKILLVTITKKEGKHSVKIAEM
jgi:hypothetical protein